MWWLITTPIIVIISFIAGKPSDIIRFFKWTISYIYVLIKQKYGKKRFGCYDDDAHNDPYKVGFISLPEEMKLESPLDEYDLRTKSDVVFCYGVNSKSESLLVKIERNRNHRAEAWINLKLSNGKVYQLKDTSGYQRIGTEKKVFSCGGLQMHYKTPMRIWRIFFNGLLREMDENGFDSGKAVYVKFSLIWRGSSEIFDFTTDIKAGALAESFSKVKWTGFTPPLEKLNKAMDLYVQCGTIAGTINIENNEDDYNIYLFGERMRLLGDTTLIERGNFTHVLGYTLQDGRFVHLSEVSIENLAEKVTFGFTVQPKGAMDFITDKSLDLNTVLKKDDANNFERKFHIENRAEPFIFLKYKNDEQIQFSNNIFAYRSKFSINSLDSSGFILKGLMCEKSTQKKSSESTYNIFVDYKAPTVVPAVVKFTEKLCRDSAITGGKGSSLGILTEMSKELQNFAVPSGFVVTTAAYKMLITKDIISEIKHLEDVVYGNIEGDVKDACKRVSDVIIETEIPDKIKEAVSQCLQKLSDGKEFQFAVRSSATGEDTEEMSAAGQMETFLGVSGDINVLTAVKKCWASQFSHIAVEYKRQNGQILNSPMAVVIQGMISCDVAGVLFTCDPLTGNPTTMSITANYGLGESVVSASEEPDTIVLNRDFEDKVLIKNVTIGAKNQRIILQDEEGTKTEKISDEERQSCCLSEQMALRLGNLAVQIENRYKSCRDIEWGFWNNNLYIFQSRPVTSGSGETEYEIDHEFDAPLRIENEYFTVCNVGEVMPGALSTLGLDILMKYFRNTFQRSRGAWELDFRPKYFPKGLSNMFSRAMFYCLDLLERMDENKGLSEAMLIAMFGRIIEDEDLFRLTRQRFGIVKKSFLYKMRNYHKLGKMLYTCRSVLLKTQKAFSNYRIPIEKFKTSEELFHELLFRCTDLCEPMGAHMVNTQSSMIYNMIIFNILLKSRGGINSDVYMDFAKLVTSNSDVESADVPAAIDDLSRNISKEKSPEELKSMTSKDILDWLKCTPSNAGIKYQEFITKHGHRCLKEFDVYAKTWEREPLSLIKLIKSLAENPAEIKENKSNDDVNKIISSLGIPFSFKSRMLLKFLIPQSRRAVQYREATKSLLIKAKDAWRKGYYQLARLMVKEGRIPKEDLLFFMTLDEIKELLETRSPKIISRANHRLKRHSVLDKYIFPEIMKGFPKPINMEDNTCLRSDGNFSMKGIPVSQGTVKAYVRVALNLEEAANLQIGEILLTYSTDIGWTPYFPILAGVVTELGGLISHGAVVSREYGLPCIAGLHGATRQFQTGDYALLDGNKGILQKLPKPESDEKTS